MAIQKVYASTSDKGFDRIGFLSDSELNTMKAGGFTVVFVDVSTPTIAQCVNYINLVLSKGFKVSLLRGYYDGMYDGGNAAINGQAHAQKLINVANALSIPVLAPPFFTLWCDIEGQTSITTKQNVFDYINAFDNTISTNPNNYASGVYVGANSYMVMTTADLDQLPTIHFWKSASNVATPSAGYMVVQTCIDTQYGCNYSGISIDRDSFQVSNYNGYATLLQSA